MASCTAFRSNMRALESLIPCRWMWCILQQIISHAKVLSNDSFSRDRTRALSYRIITMRITFKSFDSKMASREKLFKTAVEFANKIDRKDLINITHSEDHDNIVITIWYYTDEPDRLGMRGQPGVVSSAKVTPA